MADPEIESGTELPVGQYLRSVREAKGLQLDDAARVTKIGKNYLLAIEEGQFEKLPNAAYIKGFLRLYAGYLSLPGDEVVARYEKATAPAPAAHLEAEAQHTGIDTLERAKTGNRGRWLVPGLLLVAVVIAAFFLSEGEPPRVQAPPPAPAPAPPAPAPVAPPVQKPLSSAHAETPAQPAATEAAAPVARQTGIVLRLRFNQDSWLSITIDDNISQRYDLKAGDIIEWKGQRSFVLDLGDGGAVEGEFNGRPLKSLGEAGKPAHVELKGDAPAR